jgi:hypothetical protein
MLVIAGADEASNCSRENEKAPFVTYNRSSSMPELSRARSTGGHVLSTSETTGPSGLSTGR